MFKFGGAELTNVPPWRHRTGLKFPYAVIIEICTKSYNHRIK